MTISLSKIPTVSWLYSNGELFPIHADDPDFSELPKPSQSLNDRIALIRGDITILEVDAIVNAANKSLLGGGGVDGAIHKAAGRELMKECQKLEGCETGSAKITDAYSLPCKKVIHAVGPIYSSRDRKTSAQLLAGCYTTSLELAVGNKCRSIAFSALSTGVYGYPSMLAASVAIHAVKDFLEGEDGDKIDKVVFCTFVEKDVNAYDKLLPKFFPPTEQDLKYLDEWESVEAEETALNGPAAEKEDTQEDFEEYDNVKREVEVFENTKGSAKKPIRAEDLPDVPTEEPVTQGEPASKKQKSDHE